MSSIALHGKRVHLVPPTLEHAAPLEAVAGLDPDAFRYMSASPLIDGGEHYVRDMLEAKARGECIPFTVIDVATGAPIGSTRFADIDSGHPRCEIGWTWLAPSHRGGGINAEMKLLMLEHAFTALDCERVAIKTDLRNVRAQRAIEHLGATREGVLRRHLLATDGYVRDTVYYSVIAPEWDEVRAHLEQRLTCGR